MRKAAKVLLSASAAAAALVASVSLPTAVYAADPAYKVLVFSKTAAFRHDSIPAGVQAIRDLGAANNFTVDATEDANAFTSGNLAQYKAVVFLSTTGDVLNATQQTAFQSYVDGGGGYVGVHSAADTEYDWPYYGQLVGAWFNNHPTIQQATVRTEDSTHPATAGLAAAWSRTDEWYNYRTNPRSTTHVLQTLDETSYSGGNMGDHPITWCHPQASGRSFYTGMGHSIQSYSEQGLRNLLLGGIRYAAGMVQADCAPPGNSNGTTIEAESYTSQSGVQQTTQSTAGGGKAVGFIEKGDWTGYSSVSTAGATRFTARVSSAGSGGTIQIRSGSQTGTLLGQVAVSSTGSWDTFRTVSATLNGSGSGPLFLAFTGGSGYLFNVDSFSLTKSGSSPSPSPSPSASPTPSSQTVEGEAYTAQSGLQQANHSTASGGRTAGYINNGDWAAYSQVNTQGAKTFSARVSSGGSGGTIQIRSGSQNGTVLGQVAVSSTGSWDTFTTVSTALTGSASGPLYLVLTGNGTGYLYDLDTITVTR
ncbi:MULTISPECIES: ThuA domain-containing protein [Microbispora]|uniref:Carbohydrate-binding protein n=4 Tax=Microbispora TaxID=2005 RepID=A0A5J5JX70_9ACTN|nr:MULTISPECIES: ThuA domain-containing protein [Microbispora]KAA9375992.1 carbohydrate-binding protein [Microbispora cellulosiformans]TLP57882.1 carbohydrate-binding protein [Microbispora fusca]